MKKGALKKPKSVPPQAQKKISLLENAETEQALSKVLSEQLDEMCTNVAQCVCQSRMHLQEISTIADHIGGTPPYDATEAQLLQWQIRINELVTDTTDAFANVLRNPMKDPSKRDFVQKVLQTTNALEFSKKMQAARLECLRDDTKEKEKGLAPNPPEGVMRKRPSMPASAKSIRFRKRDVAEAPTSPAESSGPRRESSWKGLPALNTAGHFTAESLEEEKEPASPAYLAKITATPSFNSTNDAGTHNTLTCSHMLSASAYLVLESILVQVKAERAVLFKYIPSRDEMQAVACVGPGLPSAAQLCLPPRASLVGSVCAARTAVNIINSHIARETLGFKCTGVSSLLAIPIFTEGQSIGAALLLNKHRGYSPFTEADEMAVFSTASLLGYLLTRYPVDFVTFDPAAFHLVVPLKHSESQEKDIPHAASTPRRLIFRTQNPTNYLTKSLLIEKRAESAAPPTLHDVSEYVTNLEQCWELAVQSLMKTEEASERNAAHATTLREELHAQGKTLKMLKEIAREHAQHNMQLQAEVAQLKQNLSDFEDDVGMTPLK